MYTNTNSAAFLTLSGEIFKKLKEIHFLEKKNNSKLTKFLVYLVACRINEAIFDEHAQHELGKKHIETDAVRNIEAVIDELMTPKRKIFAGPVTEMYDIIDDVLVTHSSSAGPYTAKEKKALSSCKLFCEFYLSKNPRLDSMHINNVRAEEMA